MVLACIYSMSFTSGTTLRRTPLSGTPDTHASLAAISPDGRYFVSTLNAGVEGVWLGRTDGSVRQVLRHFSGNINVLSASTVWSPDSKTFLSIGGGIGGAQQLLINSVDGATSDALSIPGGVQSAAFSPDGLRVALVTFDTRKFTRDLLVWRLGADGKRSKFKIYFNDDVEGFTWTSNTSLFAFTPNGYNRDFEMQNFYSVDCLTGRIHTVPATVATKVGITWPYLDVRHKIIAIAGSKRLFSEASKSNDERVIEIDPITGVNTVLGVINQSVVSEWRPLSSGCTQTFVMAHAADHGTQVVVTRRVDTADHRLEPPTYWKVAGEPSVSGDGRLFGYSGYIPSYAVRVD